MNSRFSLSAFSLALATIALAGAPSAFATTYDINFSCSTADGTVLSATNAGGSAVSCSGNTSPVGQSLLTSWTQDGFIVSPSAGNYFDYGGNDGNPSPDIKTGNSFTYGTGSTKPHFPNTDAVTIAETNGGAFQFDSLDINTNVPRNGTTFYLTYTIEGYDTGNPTAIFDISCLIPSSCKVNNVWQTISATSGTGDTVTGNVNAYVNSVVVTFTDSTPSNGAIDRLDNIDVTPSPEPGTLLLLGSGLSALAIAVRRRRRA